MMENNYSLPFENYIENANKYGKFAMVITKSQYAIEVNKLTHEEMAADLIKKTRPDIKIDVWGNALNPEESYDNGNILILGYPNYVLIELPKEEMLSNEQFKCLKNILLDIKKSIDNLVKDHTVVIVAHRLSTIIDADIIHVVDGGKIVASGTHKELLEKSKIYKTLYETESLNS